MPIYARIRLTFALVLFVAVAAAPLGRSVTVMASSPVQEPTTIDDVVARYVAATKAGDWNEAAALMHPEALASFRETVVPIFLADQSGRAAKTFLGTTDPDAVDKLTDREVFARFLRGMTSAVPELSQALSASDMVVIGNVAEGPDVVHVVYRAKVPVRGITLEQVQTMPLKRDGQAWRVLLSGQMEGMAALMRSQLGQ